MGDPPFDLTTLHPIPISPQDVAQLVCELFLFSDVAPRQIEAVAVVADLLQVYGLDGMALLAFLVALRAHYGLGRAAVAEETTWLLETTFRVVQDTNAFLLSEYVGDVSFPQLVQSLLLNTGITALP